MSEREKLKKLAEAIAPNDHLKVEASTILALLSELEQSEAHWQPSEKLLFKKLTETEAALRTLRQAAERVIDSKFTASINGLDYTLIGCDGETDALAAALAAEGGK